MRFGPLGTDGGERRLNVLISRAKQRCEVFSSMTDEDIDADFAATRKGVFAFKLFLHFARTGGMGMAERRAVITIVFSRHRSLVPFRPHSFPFLDKPV